MRVPGPLPTSEPTVLPAPTMIALRRALCALGLAFAGPGAFANWESPTAHPALGSSVLGSSVLGSSSSGSPIAGKSIAQHPDHVTLTEIAVNTETRCLEVSVRVDPGQIEDALYLAFDERVRAVSGSRFDSLLQRYLRQNFLVQRHRGGWGKLRWVGLETDPFECWLHFEVTLPDRGGELRISNQMFFEVNPFQLNRLFLRGKQRVTTAECRPDDPWRSLADIDPGLLEGRPPGWMLRRPALPQTQQWWIEQGRPEGPPRPRSGRDTRFLPR